MKGVVKKWGNSAAVRFPAAVLEAMRLELDDEVHVREEGGRIVIRACPGEDLPARRPFERHHREKPA